MFFYVFFYFAIHILAAFRAEIEIILKWFTDIPTTACQWNYLWVAKEMSMTHLNCAEFVN